MRQGKSFENICRHFPFLEMTIRFDEIFNFFFFFSVRSKVLTKNHWSFILPINTRTKESLSICKSKPLIRKGGRAIGIRPPSCTRLHFNPNTSPRSSWSPTPPLKRPSPLKLLWLLRPFQLIKLQRKLLLQKLLSYKWLNEMGKSLFFVR